MAWNEYFNHLPEGEGVGSEHGEESKADAEALYPGLLYPDLLTLFQGLLVPETHSNGDLAILYQRCSRHKRSERKLSKENT